MRLGRHAVAVFLPLALGAPCAGAQPIPKEDVPRTLRDWIPWALDGAGDRVCPAVGEKAVCLWPGRLVLTLGAQGGSFALDVAAEREIDLPLPGGERRWPQDVRLDGHSAPVIADDGEPVLHLAPGSHRVDGRFTWERLPDALPVPAAVALVDLSVEGRGVPLPRREADGLLLLRQGGGPTAGGENLQLRVFRHIVDGIPLWMETQVSIDASGRAREVALAGALPADAAPISVGGDLPARLDPDGRLRVQVRAGTFTVKVLGRLAGQPRSIALPPTAPPWPPQEVWVFEATERLRQVQVSGASAVDPSRTDLPEEWRKFPAFLMEPGGHLELQETRRGEPDAAPDQIQLSRVLWLDESGGSFSVRDEFGGSVGRTSRLDMLEPGELGRAALDGQGQVVTRDPGNDRRGVEVRRQALRLEADSRLARRGALPAVGWDVGVQSLRAELLLPPGWRLFGATGVDDAPGSWLSSWNLFAFFFVLLTTIAVGRLFGRRWAALALVTLVLLHDEPDAPRLEWLALVATFAVMNAAPAGVLRTLARIAWGISLVVLIVGIVPFLVAEVRGGLYPQAAPPMVAEGFVLPMLARPPAPAGVAGGVVGGAVGGVPQSVPEAPPPPQQEQKELAKARRMVTLGDSVAFITTKADEPDPHAVVQTGAGVTEWSWTRHRLVWSGPVAPDHRMRLLLLSPGVNLLLALARVLLVLLLALRLVAAVFPAMAERLRRLGGPARTLFAIALLAGGLATPARAQEGIVPSDEMLEELRTRLTRPPACAPHCVSTAQMHLAIDGAQLRVEAEVHAAALAGWPVPGPASAWVPREITVDGQPGRALARFDDGFLRLRLAPGVHRVVVAGPLPAADSITLQFGERPRRVTAATPGWQVDGIREDGSPDESVQISRRLLRGAAAEATGTYTPWLEVSRMLQVGVSWTVETIVRRVSPAGAPVVVKVPIPEGLLVTDGERQVKDGEVLVSLGRDQMETRWSGTLQPKEGQVLRLTAAEGRPWSEVWLVSCGAVWECDATGLPPVARTSDGRLVPEFRPWPGESLTLTFRRPKGAEGPTLTIDRASLQLVPGVRLEDASLDLVARASRTGPLVVTLPSEAEVREVKVGGHERPIRPENGRLAVTVDAGQQAVHLAWRQPWGMRMLQRAAGVALDRPAVNVHVTLQVPPERWILLAGGPSWGPAVLFWGYLIVVLLAAAILARIPGSGLTTGEWILLGLGLAQLPAFGAFIVAGWFVILGWRRDRVLARPVLHDLMQLALVVWTLLALGFLYEAVHQGLVLRPDMQVAGGDSSDTLLQWYQDRVDGALPRPWVLSVPMWVYRVAMLLWSLWMALALVRWLPRAWASFSSGSLWQPILRRRPRQDAPPAAP
jgi:hypothetical protein